MERPEASKPADRVGLRILSGVVLAVLAVLAISAGTPYFEFFVALFAFVMTWEWAELCGYRFDSLTGFAVAAGALTAILFAGMDAVVISLAIIAGIGLLILLIGGVVGAQRSGWAALGLVYLAVPCIAVVWLRHESGAGMFLVIWLMVVVWATDIGAYAAGRTIGGPRLAPSISPKKTWAGLVGGLVSAAGAGALAAWIAGDVPVPALAVAGGALGIFAQIGDLMESGVKRYFGVKDSGKLIPGHGGVLDRVDGLLIAAPVLAVFVATGQRG